VCDVIRREFGSLRQEHVTFKRFAVLCIIIPLAAFRFAVAAHEQPGFLAHCAIEMLHGEMLAALGPFAKFAKAAHETIVGQNCDITGELVRPFCDGLLHPPFAWLHDVDGARTIPFASAGNFACKAA